jgi:7-cyano-7-deazaguanine synthase
LKAIILLSGGLDSTTCLAYAKSQNYECYALSFFYNQKQKSELTAAANIAREYKVMQHQIIDITSITALHNTSLVDENIKVEDYSGSNTIPNTYVPARNTILLAIALGYAEVIDANHIFIGASHIDYSGYPDCRPEYFEAFKKLANLATCKGAMGDKIIIETPLLNMSKAETIKLGMSLGVDYSKTVTCYRADKSGLACGTCDSCFHRKKGFKDAGVVDPTHYLV